MTDKQTTYAELPTCHIDGYVREWRSGICTADEAMRGIAAHAAQAPVTDLQNVHDAVTVDLLNERVAYLEAKLKEAQAPQQTTPADGWLEQAYREGWAACRDAETIGQEAEDWAFGNSTANSRMIDMQQAAPQQEVPVVGNSGFDHRTAVSILDGKAVSDEYIRKFVQASRWAHDDRASLQATLQSVRNELASREAEIALLKKALMDAEPAPQQQEVQEPTRTSGRNCYLCGHPEEAHPMEPDPRGGMRRGSCPMTAAWSAPSGDARELFDAGWKACARFCNREDAIFDGIVGDTGCPQFEAAYDAARKEANKP